MTGKETKAGELLSCAENDQTEKRAYAAPRFEPVGTAAKLVQGCGGAAGQDRNYYRIFCE